MSFITCLVRPFQSILNKLRGSHKDSYQKTHDGPEQSQNESRPAATVQVSTENSTANLINATATASIEPQHSATPSFKFRAPTLPIETSNQGSFATVATNSLNPSPPGLQSANSSIKNPDADAVHRSRASSKGSTTDESSLKEQLRRARRECPRRAHSFFVPEDTQEKLVTVNSIARDIQERSDSCGEDDARATAEDAHKWAKKLYAVLALVKKGSDIKSLLEEGLSDRALPLAREENEPGLFSLQLKDGTPIKTFSSWSEKDREKFDRVQYWMTAPVFHDKVHYELNDKTILPFVPFGGSSEMKKSKQGGYSEVYPVRLHPAHHRFWKTGPEDKEPLIAVKKLISPDESEFEKEVTILKALGSKSHPHPHLIKLLATYRQKQKYHLMFPYANANLRNYWEERPFPDFDDTTVLWSMKQMTGMASALLNIHNFRVTIPLNVAGPGEKRIQKDAELSVRPGEELFGRHGDIKPENILWFEKIPESNDPRGVLQIADFGLGRFHGRDSRSKVNPDTVLTSPTYEPPECKLRRPVSRAYDLWSLGCLYLEFITWLLRGSAEIENFSNFRGRLSSTGIDDDNFFTISRDPVTGPEAAVRDSVIDWVEGLHHHEKCSALMHELLDMIMDQLLIVDSGDRAGAQWLYFQMKALLEKAETDRDYLLRPVPPTQKRNAGGRSKSTSDILGPPKPFARRQISTTDRETIQPLPKFPKPSPDLVGRAAGTPGMKKGKSVTWPVKQMNT